MIDYYSGQQFFDEFLDCLEMNCTDNPRRNFAFILAEAEFHHYCGSPCSCLTFLKCHTPTKFQKFFKFGTERVPRERETKRERERGREKETILFINIYSAAKKEVCTANIF
ncbi:hypothetical protein FHG87_000972 [Trinorchestia longiramus]|nr:hypothetical protein FHG87_000972 [Trinorchestia longiramus]